MPCRSRLGRRLYQSTAIAEKRPPLREEFRRELTEFFRPEVEKLESILGRDLKRWAA